MTTFVNILSPGAEKPREIITTVTTQDIVDEIEDVLGLTGPRYTVLMLKTVTGATVVIPEEVLKTSAIHLREVNNDDQW